MSKNTTKYPFEKIVVNSSFGKLTSVPEFETKVLPEIAGAISAITGQKPQQRPAKKSIAGFKIREGMIVGLKVTLRGKKMMQFFEKTINVVIPRIRDFRGIELSTVDSNGNLTFGIKEHTVFPEIVLENSRVVFGIQITAVPKGKFSHEKALELFKKLGVPFVKKTHNK